MNKMQRADGAKLLANFVKVANVIPVNKNIVIGITHLMGNPTGYGAEFKEKLDKLLHIKQILNCEPKDLVLGS